MTLSIPPPEARFVPSRASAPAVIPARRRGWIALALAAVALAGTGATTGLVVGRMRVDTWTASAASRSPEVTERLVADVPVAQPSCPSLTPVDPPWLVVGPAPPHVGTLPEAPRSLERRVDFWLQVWGELGDNQHLLVDDRRPWVAHALIDCRDLFGNSAASEDAKAACGGRLTQARRTAQAGLKKSWASPSTLRLFDGNAALARTAADHIIGVQGRKDALARATTRAAPHLGLAEGLFAVADVPRIYARAAIVESLWRPEALSRSGAAGAYQFMPRTGRQFLAVEEGIVDERLDPLRSSWAAATYMSKMSQELKEWPLVLTAYNTGPARLKRVMKLRGTRDLGRIADAGTVGEFGFDGQNYYSQIVAIGRLTANARFEPRPVTGRALRLDAPLAFADLAACVETEPTKLAEANPALAQAVIFGETPVPAGYVAHVPSRDLKTASR